MYQQSKRPYSYYFAVLFPVSILKAKFTVHLAFFIKPVLWMDDSFQVTKYKVYRNLVFMSMLKFVISDNGFKALISDNGSIQRSNNFFKEPIQIISIKSPLNTATCLRFLY